MYYVLTITIFMLETVKNSVVVTNSIFPRTNDYSQNATEIKNMFSSHIVDDSI